MFVVYKLQEVLVSPDDVILNFHFCLVFFVQFVDKRFVFFPDSSHVTVLSKNSGQRIAQEMVERDRLCDYLSHVCDARHNKTLFVVIIYIRIYISKTCEYGAIGRMFDTETQQTRFILFNHIRIQFRHALVVVDFEKILHALRQKPPATRLYGDFVRFCDIQEFRVFGFVDFGVLLVALETARIFVFGFRVLDKAGIMRNIFAALVEVLQRMGELVNE